MIAALIIVFREVLEAGLIVGVVLAASRGVPQRGQMVLTGIAAGIIGSAVVAAFAAQITSAFDGRGQELLGAAVLGLAVIMLAWHVVWMAQHAKELTAHLRDIGRSVALGKRSVAALGVAVGLAVMREGSEVVLFITSIAMQGEESAAALLLGSAGGLLLGAIVSAIVYFGLAAIPLGALFRVTGLLLAFLAAGLAAQAVNQLSNAGVLTILQSPLWDTSWLLSEESWPGRVLHVLVGYMDRPTVLQGLVYAATVLAIIGLANINQERSAAPH